MQFLEESKITKVQDFAIAQLREGKNSEANALLIELLLSYRSAISQFLVMDEWLRTPIKIAIDASKGDVGVFLVSGPHGQRITLQRIDQTSHTVTTGDLQLYEQINKDPGTQPNPDPDAPPPQVLGGVFVVCPICHLEFMVADVTKYKVCPNGHAME